MAGNETPRPAPLWNTSAGSGNFKNVGSAGVSGFLENVFGSDGDSDEDIVGSYVFQSNDNKPTFGNTVNNLLGDEYMMGNLTGLAGTVMQAIALPQMLKSAKLQNDSLSFNLDTAKKEQARRRQNISSFNAHPSAANKSAFV